MTLDTRLGKEPSLPRWAEDTRFVLLLYALWLLITLGWRPLLLPDEGRYASVAREMLLGDGWTPTLNGLPYFHKPPLMYWLDMAAMQIFGVTAFAARFAPFVGAWLMGAALYLHLCRHQGARAAAITLAVLATCPGLFVGAQYANHDMLVAGLITVAVLCAVRAFEDTQNIAKRWLLASWAACGFAVLAKGLIGFVLPGLVVLPWLLAQRRWRHALGLLWPPGLLLFALIAAPWFVLMQQRFPEFLDYFFVEQHFRRFAQSNFNNVHGAWFYWAVLPLLALPWVTWLPALVKRWRKACVPVPYAGFYLWWVVAVAGFFSLPSSKLVGYVLPALAPLVMLLAWAITKGRAWRWVLPMAALACVAFVGVLAVKAPKSNRDVALDLAARVQPGHRVVFIDEAFFDIPFYAQLSAPPVVLSRWRDPTATQRDNWRKELFDAARFDPAIAARVLVPEQDTLALLCAPGVTWFVGGARFRTAQGESASSPLAALQTVFEGRNALLMQWPDAARARWCP